MNHPIEFGLELGCNIESYMRALADALNWGRGYTIQEVPTIEAPPAPTEAA